MLKLYKLVPLEPSHRRGMGGGGGRRGGNSSVKVIQTCATGALSWEGNGREGGEGEGELKC